MWINGIYMCDSGETKKIAYEVLSLIINSLPEAGRHTAMIVSVLDEANRAINGLKVSL